MQISYDYTTKYIKMFDSLPLQIPTYKYIIKQVSLAYDFIFAKSLNTKWMNEYLKTPPGTVTKKSNMAAKLRK